MMTQQQRKIAEKGGITFPTILPLFSAAFNKEMLKEWVEKHNQNDNLREIAKKIAENINYISFEKFLEQLKIVISDFTAKIKENYVIWITQHDYIDLNISCSELWVIGLALEYCTLRWPEAIVRTNHLKKYLENNKHIKSILILDDAAYSGSHVVTECNHFQNAYNYNANILENYHIYLGIPFITETAKTKIKENFLTKLDILENIEIKTLQNILSKEDITYLNEKYSTVQYKTLTYFDHRFPDCWSTLPQIEHGDLLFAHNESKQPVRFIPTIIPPYRLKDPDHLSNLKNALEKKQTGERLHEVIPEHYPELITLLTQANEKYVIKTEKSLIASEPLFFKPRIMANFVIGACIFKLLDYDILKFMALCACFAFLFYSSAEEKHFKKKSYF